jgi:hypothetical protein
MGVTRVGLSVVLNMFYRARDAGILKPVTDSDRGNDDKRKR